MEKIDSFTNVLSRKGINNFLSDLSPVQKLELRTEQFINLTILNFMDEAIELACEITNHRRGKIMQSKDFRFSVHQQSPSIFPNLDFFDSKILKKTKKKKKKNWKS
ncbi:hypothetical protein CMESO_214 (nucleomorph) [Chroomonas mesostigmatica CCMP1168]|uniref:Uncharacterized protein n=1 Tax=Chroomonas mesostigmatica CCMP1168 TaxID=1195612 RepID=J7G1M6_9CRYP|nr:hypothetical protein CMESO_214 [Chroomonas mesostigmatica CCMP1168]